MPLSDQRRAPSAGPEEPQSEPGRKLHAAPSSGFVCRWRPGLRGCQFRSFCGPPCTPMCRTTRWRREPKRDHQKSWQVGQSASPAPAPHRSAGSGFLRRKGPGLSPLRLRRAARWESRASDRLPCVPQSTLLPNLLPARRERRQSTGPHRGSDCIWRPLPPRRSVTPPSD